MIINEWRKTKESKHDMYGCSLQEKHTEFAFEDPQMLHRRGVSGVLHQRTRHKASYKHLLFVFITYLSADLCFPLFPALSDGSALFVIHSPSEPIRQGLSTCSLCTAGKWISIYGSVSVIVAHSFLSGQSTSQAEPEMGWWPPICQHHDGCFADTIK